jgi:hypothetical protein
LYHIDGDGQAPDKIGELSRKIPMDINSRLGARLGYISITTWGNSLKTRLFSRVFSGEILGFLVLV